MFFSHCFGLHSAFQKKFDLTLPKAGNTFCKKKNWKGTFDRNLTQVSISVYHVGRKLSLFTCKIWRQKHLSKLNWINICSLNVVTFPNINDSRITSVIKTSFNVFFLSFFCLFLSRHIIRWTKWSISNSHIHYYFVILTSDYKGSLFYVLFKSACTSFSVFSDSTHRKSVVLNTQGIWANLSTTLENFTSRYPKRVNDLNKVPGALFMPVSPAV